MLAQNFKAATDLGLTDEQFSAFVKVLGLMERKEIPEHLFTMLHVGEPELEGHCGTAGCIVGWARFVSPALKRDHWRPSDDDLAFTLCFPCGFKYDAYSATQEQAAAALRNFLTYGEPHWDEVMS